MHPVQLYCWHFMAYPYLPPDFDEIMQNIVSRGFKIEFSVRRYRPVLYWLAGLLHDIGIEGSNLASQQGLIREAADMQRIANTSKEKK